MLLLPALLLFLILLICFGITDILAISSEILAFYANVLIKFSFLFILQVVYATITIKFVLPEMYALRVNLVASVKNCCICP